MSDIEGKLGEEDCRGGEQLEGAVAARTWHCSTDYVHVYVTSFSVFSSTLEQMVPTNLSLALLLSERMDLFQVFFIRSEYSKLSLVLILQMN